ncbi:MAG: diguanylate cyclase [Gammaproteobacteria bacterium]|nr:diguanylate cyclase [Gammaproteobacteria bacterium]MBL7000712.1 diguanylate cyclase [Gammaproteobacteria bacterium]
MPGQDDIQQQLAALRLEFAANLGIRVDQMIADLNGLVDHSDPATMLHDIFRQIHSLSGSAGTFGFFQLSEQSRQLELILKEAINQKNTLDSKTTKYLVRGLQALHTLIENGPENTSIIEPLEQLTTPSIMAQRLIYIVEDEAFQGQDLCLQLQHYGFRTHLFSSATDARKMVEMQIPDALVLDIILPEGVLAGTQFASEIRQLLQQPVPALFISQRKDWESRLAAVRAGGSAYLEKPLDISELVNHLDLITQRVRREPYRVLVVDDTEELAQHYSLVLRQAGMHTSVLADPEHILEQMSLFQPELVLLDFYFPGITGLEVASVLRQHQTYFSTPIVFLSTETNRKIQLQTLQQGDDFLVKPIDDKQLISTIESRIERSRTLSELMYHDGLTGLLNQITLKRRVESELARSQRQNEPLSYLMLDIDLFKQVNDRFGHSIGDRVLKSLAQLLTDRLRKSDLIGRYGGEEFGIIMPNTSPDAAFEIIEKLRVSFSQLTFKSDKEEFKCSFSAGISGSTTFSQENKLIEAADEALYQAKESGRNKTIIHDEC